MEKRLVKEVLLSCVPLTPLKKLLFTSTETYRNFSFFSSQGLGKQSAASKNRVNYYSFGASMRERSFTLSGAEKFRFGFNGMEGDDEVKGDENSYTTEFRQYDPRLGRWMSIDPKFNEFPWQSPYAAFDNKPTMMNDPCGLAAQGGPGGELKPNADGTRSTDNGNGTSTYDAPGFTTVTIPDRAKILGTMQDLDGKNDGAIHSNGVQYQASVGDLNKFSVDGVIYTARFSNGKFMGYFSGDMKYQTPFEQTIASIQSTNDFVSNTTFIGIESVEATVRNSFKSATTVAGWSQLTKSQQVWRTKAIINPGGAKALGLAKGLGTIATYVAPVIKGVEMYQKANDGDPSTTIDGRDYADLTVGTVGAATAAGVSFGIISNPVGWVIGIACGVYGITTFVIDNHESLEQGMKARQQYIESGLMPIR